MLIVESRMVSIFLSTNHSNVDVQFIAMFDLSTSTSLNSKDSYVSLKGLFISIKSSFVLNDTTTKFVLYELDNECEEPYHRLQ